MSATSDTAPPGTVLVTGFPGFLGARLLPRILRRSPGVRATCLVQPKFAAMAEARVDALVADDPSLAGRVEMSPRAVQQAPFRVLVGANMPAALVEIGYLSNADQETQLTTGVYQDQVAQALLDGLIRFRELLEKK